MLTNRSRIKHTKNFYLSRGLANAISIDGFFYTKVINNLKTYSAFFDLEKSIQELGREDIQTSFSAMNFQKQWNRVVNFHLEMINQCLEIHSVYILDYIFSKGKWYGVQEKPKATFSEFSIIETGKSTWISFYYTIFPQERYSVLRK